MRFTWALLALISIALPASGQTAFDSGDIQPGQKWSWTFDEVMEDGHAYHCHPHPWMTGMVHVVPDTDGEIAVHQVDLVEGADPDAWGYSIEHLYIEVGDSVTWTNTGAQVHTVTEVAGGDHSDHMDDGHMDDGHADGAHDAGTDEAPGLPLLGLVIAVAIALARRR